MNDVKKVIISDYADGFCLDVFFNGDRKSESFNFDHAETRVALTEVFKALGVKDVHYQEVY